MTEIDVVEAIEILRQIIIVLHDDPDSYELLMLAERFVELTATT